MRNSPNFERNSDILQRNADGETFTSIHESYPSLAYSSLHGIAYSYRPHILRMFEEEGMDKTRKHFELTESAVLFHVSKERTTQFERRERWAEEERLQEERNEEWLRIHVAETGGDATLDRLQELCVYHGMKEDFDPFSWLEGRLTKLDRVIEVFGEEFGK